MEIMNHTTLKCIINLKELVLFKSKKCDVYIRETDIENGLRTFLINCDVWEIWVFSIVTHTHTQVLLCKNSNPNIV